MAVLLLGLLLLGSQGDVQAQPISWTGSGDGISWNDATNWDPATVPGAGDDVVIDLRTSSAYTIQTTSDRTVASLTLSSAEAVLELAADLSTSGAYSHSSGTLSGSGDLLVASKITWDGGMKNLGR